ncbi:hypothetical protein EMIT0194MI4_10221 [Pseudomonas sp. IT-194MI4]
MPPVPGQGNRYLNEGADSYCQALRYAFGLARSGEGWRGKKAGSSRAHLLIVFGRVGLHWLLQWSYNLSKSTEALDRFFSCKRLFMQVSKRNQIGSFPSLCFIHLIS